MPPEVVLQLTTVSKTTILKRRAAKQVAADQASLVVETSFIQSDETFLQDEPVTKEQIPKSPDNNFNKKMKKIFQNPSPCEHTGLLNELCSKLLKEVKQANPLEWVNHVNSARNEIDELSYWKDQMKQDIDCMLLHIQTKLYAGLDEMFSEMHNLFLEEKEKAT